MMKLILLKRVLAALSVSGLISLNANAVTTTILDFEDIDTSTTEEGPVHRTKPPYKSQGYQIEVSDPEEDIRFLRTAPLIDDERPNSLNVYTPDAGEGIYTGSNAIHTELDSVTLSLSREDGQPFSLLSLDVAPSFVRNFIDITLDGYVFNSDEVRTFTFSNLPVVATALSFSTRAAEPSSNPLETLEFENGPNSGLFNNLARLEISAGFFTFPQYDNFRLSSDVSAVPLPGAAPLMATGLMAFGFAAYRKRRKTEQK